MFSFDKQIAVPTRDNALPGRDEVMPVSAEHFVNGHPIKAPFPEGLSQIVFGLGCFWGAERIFWQQQGVYSTAVGYSAGFTRNPGYREVCTGMTGHNEVVLVVFDESVIKLEQLIRLFFESHDPTQGMRQGNDRGTQYRSGIYFSTPEQQALAESVKAEYQKMLSEKGFSDITTEVIPATEFFYAEDYHQQYLAKNPDGYCGLGGTGIEFEK